MLKNVFNFLLKLGLINFIFIPFICGAPLLPVLTIKAKKVKKTSFSKSAATAETLESQQQTTLTGALKNTLGAHLVQTGGTGKMAQLYIRGFNSEHTSVFIDEVKAHDPSSPNGGFDFGQLDIESIEKIDVSRGPHTASHGSGAVGGVVQLTTKKGKGDTKTILVGEAGSFQSYRQSLSVQSEKPYGDFYLQAGHRQVDNPSSVPYARRTLQRQYHPDPYDSHNFTSHCGLKNQQNWRLSLHNRHQRSRTRYVNEFNANPNSQDILTFDLHSLSLEGKDETRTWQPKVQVGFLQNHCTNGQDIPPFSSRSSYKGQALSSEWHNLIKINHMNTFHVGIDHQQQSYNILDYQEQSYQASPSTAVTPVQIRAHAHESSFVVGHNTLPHERLEIDLWARAHHHSRFSPPITYRTAVTYHHFETNTFLYTSYGTVACNPSLFQLFNPKSGNRSIQPEEGYGWEFGFQQILLQTFRIGTTFFQTQLRNLIAGRQLTPTLYQYNNINKSQTHGLESFIEWEIYPELKISMSHLYTSAKNLSTNETLFNRPLHKLLLNLQWHMTADCIVGLGVSHDGKQAERMRFAPYQKTYTRGPFVMRATLNYKPSRSILGYGHQEFFIRIENALNHHYEQPAGYMDPGIGFYAGLRLSA